MDVIVYQKGREKRAEIAIEVEWATRIIPVSPPLFPFIPTRSTIGTGGRTICPLAYPHLDIAGGREGSALIDHVFYWDNVLEWWRKDTPRSVQPGMRVKG